MRVILVGLLRVDTGQVRITQRFVLLREVLGDGHRLAGRRLLGVGVSRGFGMLRTKIESQLVGSSTEASHTVSERSTRMDSLD